MSLHLFREKICCGTIFRGPFGETVVDVSFLTPCSGRQTGSNGLRCLTSEMEAAKRLSEEVTAEVNATKVAATPSTDVDDEGFFDKNVASPSESSLSARSDVCESGASESGTTSPPPNVEEEEEEEEEEMMEEVSAILTPQDSLI